MPDINISVQNKVATLTNTPVVVCGNSDYTVNFTFDTEFAEYDEHTMRVTFRDKGVEQHYDIQFSGNSVALPPIYRVEAISIGVYAGDIISSTAVIVPCYYGDVSTHADPPPDIYEQLLEYLAGLQGGDRVSVYDSLYGSQVTDSATTGIADLHPKFTCDTGYYFDYEVSCTLSGRQYTKKDTLPAIGVIIYTIGYSTPLFISPFESAVAYSSYYDGKAIYSVTYDGLTWYYCSVPCAMQGVWNDSEGHLLTYSGTVNFDSTNNRVTPESVLEILQAVHAQSEED